ncbi:MAG: hypothetical protein JHC54_15350, partial [Acinetobacter sp.]|nr:hypothetical protein [Acinetobacter sp.]
MTNDLYLKLATNLEKGLISDEQFSQAVDSLDLIKGGKKATIGEIRKFGGREYIKTASGWKFHGKATGTKTQEHVRSTQGSKHATE